MRLLDTVFLLPVSRASDTRRPGGRKSPRYGTRLTEGRLSLTQEKHFGPGLLTGDSPFLRKRLSKTGDVDITLYSSRGPTGCAPVSKGPGVAMPHVTVATYLVMRY